MNKNLARAIDYLAFEDADVINEMENGVDQISLGLIAVWLVVTVAMRKQYVQSFREGLESTEVDTASPIDLSDATGTGV